MRPAIAVVLLLMVTACSRENEQNATPQASAGSGEAATAKATLSATAKAAANANEVEVVEDNALFHFAFAYPVAAAAIPALKAELDARRDDARSELAGWAKVGRDEVEHFMRYDRSVHWSVVADLPGWLSLLERRYEFTGGAHGNTYSGPMLWDKNANRARTVPELFASRAALSAAIRAPYCDALDNQRAEKRGEAIKRDNSDPHYACPDPLELTLILGSADMQHFTRIGLIADPYVAGPYVEGGYEVTLPVTPALLNAVKPEYRSAFALGR